MKTAAHSYRVHDIFSCPSNTKGEIGLELETIGKNLPVGFQKTKLWTIHPDASIKPRGGEMAAEYVFSQPVGRPKIEQALDELLEEFKLNKAQVAEGRASTSVHVHINAQKLSMQQIYTWLAVYFIFEELLVRWAGPDRVGNLFCLRAKDAEGLIKMLAACAKGDAFGHFESDTYRYAAVNVMALSKFGSLEFRALRGTTNKDVIMTWVETLLAIKDKALEYKNPVEVLADFSRRSPMGFANFILPNGMRDFVLTQQDFQDVLYDGARLTQDFAFTAPWQNQVVEKPADAKGRVKINSVSLGDTFWTDSNSHLNSLISAGTMSFTTPTEVEPPQHVTNFPTDWMVIIQPNTMLVSPTPQTALHQRHICLRPAAVTYIQQSGRHVAWHAHSNGNRYLAVLGVGNNDFIRFIDQGDYVVQ